MDFEEAIDEMSDAQELIRIAYKKLMNVQKSCPNPVGYPLKDVIITLGTAELSLSIVKADYSKEDSSSCCVSDCFYCPNEPRGCK